MGGNQRDTLRSDNVMAAIRPRIVLVCKAAAARNGRHSRPGLGNESGKQSFQNEFLNQRRKGPGAGGPGAAALISR